MHTLHTSLESLSLFFLYFDENLSHFFTLYVGISALLSITICLRISHIFLLCDGLQLRGEISSHRLLLKIDLNRSILFFHRLHYWISTFLTMLGARANWKQISLHACITFFTMLHVSTWAFSIPIAEGKFSRLCKSQIVYLYSPNSIF